MKKLFLVLCLSQLCGPLFAAVGCDLNDPDRDVARLFPGYSNYSTRYVSIRDGGGQPLLERVEKRLGDKFHGLYETIDVPYTLYYIYKGTETIGYVHGVNQKGDYGGIQVFLALDLRGIIKSFYIQKLTSRAGKDMRAREFAAQFEGLSLRDFSGYDPAAGRAPEGSPPSKIVAPARAGGDLRAVLRAVKKNLILMDEFVFSKGAK